MEQQPFNHTEWSDWRLEQRLEDVQASAQLPHGEARKTQVKHELDCLAFEIGQRLLSGQNGEIVLLEQV